MSKRIQSIINSVWRGDSGPLMFPLPFPLGGRATAGSVGVSGGGSSTGSTGGSSGSTGGASIVAGNSALSLALATTTRGAGIGEASSSATLPLDFGITTTGTGVGGSMAGVFYVDAQRGNDANPGTQSQPWRTLAKANANARPGVTFILSGTFTNQVLFPAVSGTASAKITYKGSAVLDGPGSISGTQYCVYLGARNYIVLDGLTVQNSNYINAPVTNKGIVLRSCNHNEIKNCTFNHMQTQLIGASFNHIHDNVYRQFVAVYQNGLPLTSGDVIAVLSSSHDNEIGPNNDMKYGGHSLIQVGNGLGNQNAVGNNWIHDNTLSNPWYKCVILADNGAGTIVENNQLLDANSVPTLYDSHLGQGNQIVTSSAAVQFSGENYILRNNVIDNAVADFGVITLGARWYYGAGAAAGGTFVQSLDNQIYGNMIQNSRAAAAVSFVQNYTPGTDSALPDMTGNLIHDNTISGMATSGADSWDGSNHYETVIFRSFKGATPWTGLNTNQIHDNAGFSSSNAYRSSYVNAAGATTTQVKTLAQFEALDPSNVYGNS